MQSPGSQPRPPGRRPPRAAAPKKQNERLSGRRVPAGQGRRSPKGKGCPGRACAPHLAGRLGDSFAKTQPQRKPPGAVRAAIPMRRRRSLFSLKSLVLGAHTTLPPRLHSPESTQAACRVLILEALGVLTVLLPVGEPGTCLTWWASRHWPRLGQGPCLQEDPSPLGQRDPPPKHSALLGFISIASKNPLEEPSPEDGLTDSFLLKISPHRNPQA